ncbi:MAG: hypothetical protein RLZZ468_1458 [Cyanobacteriota bacterium]|jgi:hypothetical protein
MAGIPDRAYNAACGRLASALGVSLAAARRKVDIKAAQSGLRDTAAKLALAEEMLVEAKANSASTHALLTELLEATASDANFMTED